jgi:hypothetical protein
MTTVTELPGLMRGSALYDRGFISVGLSKIRYRRDVRRRADRARRTEPKPVSASWRPGYRRLEMAHLEFVTGVEEIFDVQVLPGVRESSAVGGPPSSGRGAAG